jgi:beta-lactamase superfamily II metal-dependent hydrolase
MKNSKHTSWISLVVATSITLVFSGCGTEEGLSCTPGVCSGHGDCDDSGATIVCHCHTGYSGNQCQACDEGYILKADGDCEKAEGCKPDTCHGNGICSEDHGVESCECYQGYAGTYCNKCAPGYVDVGDNFAICVNENTCTDDSCNRHGTCDDSQGSIVCSCNLGYSGAACENCAAGFHRADDQGCVADEVCQFDSCNTHGECEISQGLIVCNCDLGYSGHACENCAEGFHRTDDQSCVANEVCQPDSCNNHGDCDDSSGEISCDCQTEYAGLNCERCAAGYHEDGSSNCLPDEYCGPNTCNGHGECDDSDNKITCSCEPEYKGDHCDECQTGYQDNDGDGSCKPSCLTADLGCGDHGQCVDTSGTAVCLCEPAYQGPTCQSCASGYQDNDNNGSCLVNCSLAGLECGAHGHCTDSSGAAVCECDSGYAGASCQTCAAGYQDNDNNGSCLPNCTSASLDCSGHGNCNDSSGTAVCECDTGYAGTACQNCAAGYQDNDNNGSCLQNCSLADIDCGSQGHCEDNSGLALCVCNQGYTGNSCQYCATGYQDNDDNGSCLPNCLTADLYCGQHGHCDDSSGTAACDCDMGYAGQDCQSCATGFHPEGDVCMPDSAWCGNGHVDGYEECDLTDDSACPGKCSARCACPSASERDQLEIHMIDVGQGDAILVISPDGFVMLVDAGNDWDSTAILSYIDNLGISSLDYTLVSHMHADHLGGMDGVLEDMSAVACFDHGGTYNTWDYSEYDEEAGARRTMLEVGDSIDMGPDVQVDVLHSFYSEDVNENLNSIVVRITYGSTSVLLGGDCEAGCELSFDPGQIDVYKVHHHGSNDSSHNTLLDQMDAELALIPVGTDNPYGHPGWYAMQRLQDHNVDVHRTDLEGDLEVHCDGSSCSLQE